MPTDQKVTGLSPVGVTKRERQMPFPLCLQPLATCRRFFRILFSVVFTAKSGIYLNQCVNRKIPMNTAIETIEKCSDA